AHEAVEPDHTGAAIILERRIEPRQDAAAALGRDPHDRVGGDAELSHQRAVEPDRKPRAVAKLVGEMIDAGMDVRAPAVGMRVMMMRTVVHFVCLVLIVDPGALGEYGP